MLAFCICMRSHPCPYTQAEMKTTLLWLCKYQRQRSLEESKQSTGNRAKAEGLTAPDSQLRIVSWDGRCTERTRIIWDHHQCLGSWVTLRLWTSCTISCLVYYTLLNYWCSHILATAHSADNSVNKHIYFWLAIFQHFVCKDPINIKMNKSSSVFSTSRVGPFAAIYYIGSLAFSPFRW